MQGCFWKHPLVKPFLSLKCYWSPIQTLKRQTPTDAGTSKLPQVPKIVKFSVKTILRCMVDYLSVFSTYHELIHSWVKIYFYPDLPIYKYCLIDTIHEEDPTPWQENMCKSIDEADKYSRPETTNVRSQFTGHQHIEHNAGTPLSWSVTFLQSLHSVLEGRRKGNNSPVTYNLQAILAHRKQTFKSRCDPQSTLKSWFLVPSSWGGHLTD